MDTPTLTLQTLPDNVREPARRGRDPWVKFVAVFAATISVVSYYVTTTLGATLFYADAISHLEIGRRVISSTSEGLAQLGSVWLPLPQVLMLPFIWNDTLYYNGFAGSIISMLAYIGTVVFVYCIARDLTTLKVAGATAAVVFALSANVLYMQSTPMTESLLFCTTAGAVFFLQRWIMWRNHANLVWSFAWGLAAIWTRYESWPIMVCLLGVVLVVGLFQTPSESEKSIPGFSRSSKAFAHGIVAAFLAGFGVLGWMLWGQVIFGSFMSFQSGEYAKPSNWVDSTEPSIGHLTVAIRTYWIAMVDTVGMPILALAILGLVVMLSTLAFRPKGMPRMATLPVLSLLVTVPFFVFALYIGQRPLHVEEISNELYNVRFGLLMLVPSAVLTAYVVYVVSLANRHLAKISAVAVMALAATLSATTIASASVATYNEPKAAANQTHTLEQEEVSQFLNRDYDGGRLLMESYGNELVAFYGVPSKTLVYEGSNEQWEPALVDPAAQRIRWIVTFGSDSGSDKISRQYPDQPPTGYEEVFRGSTGNYRVYLNSAIPTK